ncbi:MAG: TldD/PmbA family protein [Bacillota bacterium]
MTRPLPEVNRLRAKVIQRGLEMGADYVDVRYQDLTVSFISGDNRGEPQLKQGSEMGVGVRTLADGRWGFSSTSDLSDFGLAAVVSDSLEMARSFPIPGHRVELAPVEPARATLAIAARYRPSEVDLDQRAATVAGLADSIGQAAPEITRVEYHYADVEGWQSFLSSEGAEIQTDFTRNILRLEAYAERGSQRSSTTGSIGGVGGWELIAGADLGGLQSQLAGNAIRWLDAEAAPAGSFPVILNNQAAENFVHEAVGHSAEADAIVPGASVLAGRLGQRLADEEVTVIDDPGLAGTVGHYLYDDEGVRGQRTTIIQQGVLAGYLTSRETAAALGLPPNGHGRAKSVHHPPIVRMGTIHFTPGDHSPEELFDGIDYGIYLLGKRGGQVDPAQGIFQFRPDRALLIEDSEDTRPLKGASLSGNILEILGNIEAVADDLCFDPGGCGKGLPMQLVPAGSGSPHLRLRSATIGGSRGGR